MCGKCGVIGVVVMPAIAMKSEREKERGRREEEEKREQNISPRNG